MTDSHSIILCKVERGKFEMPTDRPYQLRQVKEIFAKYVKGNTFDAFPYGPKIDVVKRIDKQPTAGYDVVTIDGPYTTRQAQEMYHIQIDTKDLLLLWTAVKDATARIVKPGGLVLCFDHNSNGMGKTRGFELLYQKNIPHGGRHTDTIITVEKRINASLTKEGVL